MHRPPSPAAAGTRSHSPRHNPRHGPKFTFTDPGTWHDPDQRDSATHDHYDPVRARPRDRLHPVPQGPGAWANHQGLPPITEATIIRLDPDRLPGDHAPQPL